MHVYVCIYICMCMYACVCVYVYIYIYTYICIYIQYQVSRIYMRKLEELFGEEGAMLTRCSYCSKLFAQRNRRHLVCPKAKIFIDYHGNVIAEHVPMAKWDMNKFLLTLRGRKMTWREIYWKCWGIITTMDCSVCRLALPASKRSCVCLCMRTRVSVCVSVFMCCMHVCVCRRICMHIDPSIDACLYI